MSKITYDDKIDLHVDSSIANINKVSASDMNEIKSVVNGNAEDVGDISTLTTTDKTSVVNAINELETDKLETSAVVNEPSTETDEVYSSDYLNDKLVSVGTTAPTDGRRVWFKKSKNLFNKNDVNVLNAYFSSSQTTIAENVANRTIYVPCKPNTTYTMRKISSSQFTVGYTKDLPTIGTQVYAINNTQTTIETNYRYITITTGDDAKYIVSRMYHTSQDTNITFDEVCATIQIEEGSTATTYEPYIEPSINVDEEEWYSKPIVLWQNSTPTSEFANQTITLNDNITNYSYYEILYFFASNDNNSCFNTGKLPINKNTKLSVPTSLLNFRNVTIANNTSVTFGHFTRYTSYNSSATTTYDNSCIPYQVLGYK